MGDGAAAGLPVPLLRRPGAVRQDLRIDAGVPVICQTQTMRHVEEALDAGAMAIVAQGTEAGGHGGRRATLPFVPEVADLLAKRAPEVLLLAAGGIADGRGLAAGLMLGADGALVGTRFWAAEEALTPPAAFARARRRRRRRHRAHHRGRRAARRAVAGAIFLPHAGEPHHARMGGARNRSARRASARSKNSTRRPARAAISTSRR